ncbi:2-nitropropane dioxygenase [Dichomitus squalens LYAD-421 SS1]|uniref:2-nitropropane dioxygenase n=1 Tax=Dichomitus squalens (strain LYAD-421) TaxID=732165 RepID=UPI000441563B|nr:2-nitropropane dioxygenase [Dichomitus squalens LYAD-421 SS1]EJF64188.1 2-nitropropane dioxygenase [Dichomitus squalens LYAD-421 SS1]
MAGATSPTTALEVTRGGGFGFVGAAFSTPEKLAEDLTFVRDSIPDLGNKPLPIGIGFIGWLLDAKEDVSKQFVDVVLENDVRAVWLAFGDDVYRWIEYVRSSPANARASHKPLIFVQVTSVEEALLAAKEWKADVIVAQGTEAGGHGGATTPSTFTLVSEILAALPGDGAPPVLAAGGMATGSQVAAYLTLGAAGAVLGTRFLLTTECPYTDAQKAALLAAKSGSTVRTMALDYARGTYGWPKRLNGRGIRNKIVDEIEAGVPHEIVQEKYKKGTEANDADYMVVWCGQGVSLMKEIKPMKDVMAELHTDIVRQLQKTQGLLDD